MGQPLTLLNTNTINLTKALSITQGLFLCLVHTIIKTNTISQTITRTLTLSHTKTNTLSLTISHTNANKPGITNTPTMESPPWEFCPSVGILCDKYVTPTWEFVPSVGICLHPPWEFDLVLAEEEII